MILDEEYERNSLLFCAGFVLRRSIDPRPFQPLLSKWAETLKRMEIEDYFLTRQKSKLQGMLSRLLTSLNIGESNTFLNPSNALHLKLYRPPRLPSAPVPDHAVPILLRKDWQISSYDWDLAINWVIMHIDGVNNAKAISVKSEVDLEMVKACLRVLEYHDVIATVDMFFYSNHYESTPRASSLLRGKEPKLLQEAYDFCCQRKLPRETGVPEMDIVSSFPPPVRNVPPKLLSSTGEDHPRREARQLKSALAELYYSFDRDLSFQEIWIQKLSKPKDEGPAEDPISKRKSVTEIWKTAFQDLDHRRLAIFGVIHGIIKRVHNYPFIAVPGVALEPQYSMRVGNRKQERETRRLAFQISQNMNGRTCDDALVCRYNRPIDDLIESVQLQTKSTVMSLYATASHGSSS